MVDKGFSDKLNLMEVTTNDNLLKITVLSLLSLRQEEYCSVELRIKISHQEA